MAEREREGESERVRRLSLNYFPLIFWTCETTIEHDMTHTSVDVGFNMVAVWDSNTKICALPIVNRISFVSYMRLADF